MRISEPSEYREGIVLDRPTKPGKGSLINCGMRSRSTRSCKLASELQFIINATQKKGDVFTQGPHKDGYDVTIGTSEKGGNIDGSTLPPFKHLLVVFGGLQGLEASVDGDENLDVTDPSLLFDLYLNTCPSQGSRTIRTEEAILISMAGLRPKILSAFSGGPLV
ncbi:hypothetical protein CRUP_002911 [Coryphaenoides rupestris]|nr:hypothetical protein CRUP_002911 [Coryphaenoides rupestris]